MPLDQLHGTEPIHATPAGLLRRRLAVLVADLQFLETDADARETTNGYVLDQMTRARVALIDALTEIDG